MRIGIDVDDVLAESLPASLEAFRRRFGHRVKLEEAAWDIFRRYPEIPEAERGRFFQFDRPWSQGEVPAGVTRVTAWAQVLTRVAGQAERDGR